MKRIELAGGPATALADVGGTQPFGGTWSRNGTLLFAPRDNSGLFRIAESGGTPEIATTLDATRGDVAHLYPQFLPDGQSFLFTVRGPREPGIYVGSIGSTDMHRILADSSHAQYVDPGYVVFQRGRAVLAVPFDARRLEVSGPAFAIADQVFARQYFATAAGDIAYRFDGGISAQITWYARDGRRLKSVATPGPYRQLALSPSGRRVAIQSGEVVSRGAEADILMLDLATGILSRLTTDPALDSDPSWSPDERRLAFTSNRAGRSAVFVKDLTSGTETPLFDFPETVVLDEWTPDGKYIVFRSRGRSILALPMSVKAAPRVVVDRPTNIQDQSHVSPDGRWIAFNSDESGTWEVYVGAFPDFSNRQQVSTSGGMQPMWRRDGRELFYMSPQGELMAVEIHPGDSATIESGVPRALFRTPLNPSVQVGEYAVAPDGQRFLFLEPVGDRSQSISWLLNWPAKPR